MKIPFYDNGILLAVAMLVAVGTILLADRYAADIADQPIVVQVAQNGADPMNRTIDTADDSPLPEEGEEALDTRRSDAQVALMTNPELAAQPAVLLDELDRLRAKEGDSLALLNDLGVVALRAGKTDAAIQFFKSAIAIREDYARAWYNLGIAFDRGLRFIEAADAFRQALEHKSGYQEAALQLAHSLRDGGDLHAARDAYSYAAEISNSEDRARALFFEGSVLVDLDEQAEAVSVFRRSIEYNPRDANTWFALGEALFSIPSERDSALAAIENAVALSPARATVQTEAARILTSAGFGEVALRYLQRVLEANPSSFEARRELARLFSAQGNLAAAEVQLKWLAENSDNDVEAIHYRAERAIVRNDLDEAVQLLQAAIAAGNGEDIDTRLRLGLILRRAGRDEEAYAEYAALLDAHPDNADALAGAAGAAVNLGKDDRAQVLLDHALQVRPDDPDGWFMLGRLRETREDLAGAIEAYERCLAIDGNYRSAALNLAIVKRRVGEPREAVALYQTILASNPRYTLARYNLAVVQSLMGDDEAAAENYELVLEQDPENDKARLNLAVIRREAGRPGEAEELLRDALARDARNVSARFNLALLLGATDRDDEQEVELRRILQLDSGFSKAWRSLGRLLQNRGELDEAAEMYLHALDLDPEATISTAFNLASELEHQGELMPARRLYEAVLSKDASYSRAAINLAGLDRQEGHPESAVAVLEPIVEKEPDNKRALFEFALAVASVEGPAAAIPQMERLAAIDPQWPNALSTLAEWKQRAGAAVGASVASDAADALPRVNED